LWQPSKPSGWKAYLVNNLPFAHITSDAKLIDLWLDGKAPHTQSGYRRDVRSLLEQFLDGCSIQELAIEDLYAYKSWMGGQGYKPATVRRKLAAVKSLLSFAARLQYIPANVGALLSAPKLSTTLAGRILTQSEVFKLFALEENARNLVFLKTVYYTGARVSEVYSLLWRSFSVRDGGIVQVNIIGKGSKPRSVVVPKPVWSELCALKASAMLQRSGFANAQAMIRLKDQAQELAESAISQGEGFANANSPVFPGRDGQPMSRVNAHNIVKAAAKRAKLPSEVSCHWLRHAHAQHALHQGASIELVRDTLGHASISTTNQYLESNPADSSSNYLSA